MTGVDSSETTEPDERPAVESYDPWEQMFKRHFEAPRLEPAWTAPVTDDQPL